MGDLLWQPESQRFTTFTDSARLHLQGLENPVQQGITGPTGADSPPFGLQPGGPGSLHVYPLRIVGSPETGLLNAASTSADIPIGYPTLHPIPPSSSQQPRPYSGAEKGNTTGEKKVSFASPSSSNPADSFRGKETNHAWKSPNPRILCPNQTGSSSEETHPYLRNVNL
ncbi:hypothetical protein R1flu_001575 [Riccia fluitans]|uniref:Uncharacterized protein n=1 Tax=Riccia fluitans TaxID=41844 RepID=A0ABD1Y3U7_9MARC